MYLASRFCPRCFRSSAPTVRNSFRLKWKEDKNVSGLQFKSGIKTLLTERVDILIADACENSLKRHHVIVYIYNLITFIGFSSQEGWITTNSKTMSTTLRWLAISNWVQCCTETQFSNVLINKIKNRQTQCFSRYLCTPNQHRGQALHNRQSMWRTSGCLGSDKH